ncbi:hypothetical protein L218DRAFT_957135 [Marasmius fiardii PR-910]|nr:hypothetical protein L218DRAFT_957135 [Marasmius fiardii PR-910]
MDVLGLWKPGQPFKFVVLDLSSAREERSQQPQGFADAETREESDEEWLQCVPPPPVPESNDVRNGVDPFDDVHEPQEASVASSEHTPTPRLDRGKNRAVEIEEVPDEVSTAVSVDAPVQSQEEKKTEEGSIDTLRTTDRTTPTPEFNSLGSDEKNDVNDDPPLPSLDAASLEAEYHLANPSLSSDIANLISSLSSIISSHPELSEGVRNVIQTAIRGDYWPAQREALQRAAGNVSESLNRVDQEAGDVGRRVAEALESFFQTFAQLAMNVPWANVNPNNTSNASANTQEQPNATTTVNDERETVNSYEDVHPNSTNSPFRGHDRFWQRGYRTPWNNPHFRAHGFGKFGVFGPWGRRPHHHPHHPPHHHNQHNHFSHTMPGGFPGMFGRHHPPPPPGATPPPPPPPAGPPPGSPGAFPPPPGPPPPPEASGANPPPPPPPPPPPSFPFGDDFLGSFGRVGSFGGGNFFTNGVTSDTDAFSWDIPNHVHVDSSASGATGPTQTAGAWRHSFPQRSRTVPSRRPPSHSKTEEGNKDVASTQEDVAQAEETEVPARSGSGSNTHSWTLHRRATMENARESRRREREKERGSKRLYKILRNLSDMGFFVREHPELLNRVQDLLFSSPTQKDDEIVTTVVNEVLSKPVTSTSEVNLPGGWE